MLTELPVELITIIILYLDLYKLAVCRSLYSLYTDNIFKSKLLELYKLEELSPLHTTSYKDLYKRQLSICRIGELVGTDHTKYTGIKAVGVGNRTLILTFLGDLEYYAGGNYYLVDKKVIDIDVIAKDVCKLAYINKYSVHLLDLHTREIKCLARRLVSSNPYIAICHNRVPHIYAVRTKDEIHLISEDSTKIVNIANYSQVAVYNDLVLGLDSVGDLYIVNDKVKCVACNVTTITAEYLEQEQQLYYYRLTADGKLITRELGLSYDVKNLVFALGKDVTDDILYILDTKTNTLETYNMTFNTRAKPQTLTSKTLFGGPKVYFGY